jgi:ketosteroid isomerase-like protein
MTADNQAVVLQLLAAFHAQDRAAAEALIAPDYVFTSPQDDHIDRATFFDRCFPTSSRFRSHDVLSVLSHGDDVVLLYEYVLTTGERYRNVEVATVRGGQLVETQVFFGGRY